LTTIAVVYAWMHHSRSERLILSVTSWFDFIHEAHKHTATAPKLAYRCEKQRVEKEGRSDKGKERETASAEKPDRRPLSLSRDPASPAV
jgi:hypothetical protein